MRLLYVISEPSSERSTASEFQPELLVREACSQGHDVHVLGLATRSWVAPDWINSRLTRVDFCSDDVPQHLPSATGAGQFTVGFESMDEPAIDSYLAILERELGKLRRAFLPDMVHVDGLWLSAAMARSAIYDRRVVADGRNLDLELAARCPQLMRRIVPLSREIDAVIATLPSGGRRIADTYAIRSDRLKVVSTGLDTTVFCPPRLSVSSELKRAVEQFQLRLPTRASRRVICICQDNAWREIGRLVRLFDGWPPLDGAMLILVAEAGTRVPEVMSRWTEAPRVHFVDNASRDVTASLLRGSHVAVVFARPHQAVCHALQAVACGCPVLMRQSPEVAGWPDHFWPGSPVATSDCIARLPVDAAYATDGSRFDDALKSALQAQLAAGRRSAMGQAAMAVMSRAGWESIFRTLEKDVYEPLLRQKQGASLRK